MASIAGQFPYLEVEQASGVYIIGSPAVTARNLYVLLGRFYRGDGQIVPDVPGEMSYPEELAAGFHQIELLIKGAFKSDGTIPAISPQAQLYLTMQELSAATGPLAGNDDGTRACTLHLPDGSSTLAADCRVSTVEYLRADGPNMEATLQIKVPSGEFT